MELTIGGVSVTRLLQPGSLECTDDLNARNTLRFTLRGPAATAPHPLPGQEVILLADDGTTRRFAGTIDDPQETLLPAGRWLVGHYTAVDFNQLPDRFLVVETYAGVATEAIARDLVTTYLAADGVTIGTIDAGPTITRKLFNYRPLTEALEWLTEQTGYPWEITYRKVFHLRAPSGVGAPFAADRSTCLSMSARRPRGAYRNRQYIRAGHDLTRPRVESFTGDGTRRTFTVAFPAGAAPTVTVNAVAQTIGIRGVETGHDWYWNKESTEISQDDAAPP